MAGTTAATAASTAQLPFRTSDSAPARARTKSTFHVFLPPSLAVPQRQDVAQPVHPRKQTKLVKVSGSRRSKTVTTSPTRGEVSTASEGRLQSHKEKENAPPAAKCDKGKQREVVVPGVETSMSAFFPRPPPAQAPTSLREECLRNMRTADEHASSNGSSTSSVRPTPTPAEEAAARLAARQVLNAETPSSGSSILDITSPGVGRGVPPGEQYESRLDLPTSWTDTFMQGLDAHEADLTSRGTHGENEWTGPFSIGTTCTGRALQCHDPREEGVQGKEPEGEGYVSGPQAEQSIGRALRAESEVRQIEENRRSILRQAREDDDGLSIWPVPAPKPAVSGMSSHGRDKSTNRVRFVSAKHAMASTQTEGDVRRQQQQERTNAPRTRPLLEVIPSRQPTPQSTSSKQDSTAHISHSDTEEEEELVLTTPRRRQDVSTSMTLQSRAGQSTSRQGNDSDASRRLLRDQSSTRAGTWVRDMSRRSAELTAPVDEATQTRSTARCESCGCNSVNARKPAQSTSHRRLQSSAETADESRSFDTTSRDRTESTNKRPRTAERNITVQPPPRTSAAGKPVCRFTFSRTPPLADTVNSSDKVCRVDMSNTSADISRRGVKRVRSDPMDASSDRVKTKALRRTESDQHRSVTVDTSEARSSAPGSMSRGTHTKENRSVADKSRSAEDSCQHKNGEISDKNGQPQGTHFTPGPPADRSLSTSRPSASVRHVPTYPSRPPLVPSKLAQSFTAESLERSEPSLLSETQGGTQGESNASSANATGLDSIPPPPTLNFDPHHITSISTILSSPKQFLSARNGGPRDQTSAPRINLLALVREVGALEEVGTKVYKNGKVVEGAVNMTLRSELVLMDRSGSLLKVCIWGECARQWAGGFEPSQESDDEDDAGLATQSMEAGRTMGDITTFSAMLRPGAVEKRDRAKKICPSLQKGDVISLESIIISLRRSGNYETGDASTTAIGLNQQQVQIQGSASERTNSRAELCWRWNTKNAREKRKYTFDPVLSTFDRRCKEVWKCAETWDRRE